MKTNLLISAAAAVGVVLPAAAMANAQDKDYQAEGVVVVETGRDGRATIVSIDGQRYAVCSRGRTDDCINPRAAGLDWGNRPLPDWPGDRATARGG